MHKPGKQNYADMLLGIAQTSIKHRTPLQRLAVIKIQTFERMDVWHESAFFAAVGRSGKIFRAEEGGLIAAADLTPDQQAQAVIDLINDYAATTGQSAEREYPDPMGIVDAADYLGRSVALLKKAIYREGTLKGRLINARTLVFTKAELDEFRENRNSPGRPW